MQTEGVYGQVTKMATNLSVKNTAEYWLVLGEEKIFLNDMIGREFELSFRGEIRCLDTGKLIKKTYNQGYSYESFLKLAICDQCIMKPSLCHYAAGTCREPKWGEKYCMTSHYVYLALSSQVKVGITRGSQVPTRWIDQGAVKGLIIGEVKDRYTSGLIEDELAKEFSDRTQWQKMIKGEVADIDLYEVRENIFRTYADLFDAHELHEVDKAETVIHYPVIELPKKLTALSFDKTPTVSGRLLGIKGQYLLFESGVLNIRKHQGYFLNFREL